MVLRAIAKLLVRYPWTIVFILTLISGTCIITPFAHKNFPAFADPQMGFDTRGTPLSKCLVAWRNLIEVSKASAQFVTNPQDLIRYNLMMQAVKHKKERADGSFGIIHTTEYLHMKVVASNMLRHWNALESYGKPKTRRVITRSNPESSYLCGNPTENYAHVVVVADEGGDLFNWENLHKICRLEMKLLHAKHYRDLCILAASKNKKCCKPWSVGNYIAALNNRPSCLAVTRDDIKRTKEMLSNCSKYFHESKLAPNCEEYVCQAPDACVRLDAVFSIMNFFVPTTFLPANSTNDLTLTETIIMLPIAISTGTLDYYKALEPNQMRYKDVSIVAMELGLKNFLFDESLLENTWLMLISAIFVIICMWLYTNSLFITIMTIIAIVYSLGISYFFYTVVFDFGFFPFMNLLTGVVAIGIGADDAFIFCKMWAMMQQETTRSLNDVMHATLTHSMASMFVTSLTTAVAFLTSYMSSITALRCFGVFTGVAVLANYMLMISWLPAAMAILQMPYATRCAIVKRCTINCNNNAAPCRPRWNPVITKIRSFYSRITELMDASEHYVVNVVIQFKYLLFTTFTIVAVISSVIVFYYPKLQLPNSSDFQLFDSKHPFEQYDMIYRDNFWFTHADKEDSNSSDDYKLPLRFVWGVKAEDNGNQMDPQSLGTLELDTGFSISAPENQVWLLHFCKDLRKQRFYEYSDNILESRCFIEAFITWMGRRCEDPINGTIDLSPCCETSVFPYNASVFDLCIADAMSALYETPARYFVSKTAGPRFSTDGELKLQVIVIEFDSKYSYSTSYRYMEMFMNEVTTWFDNQMLTAPASLKGGWFVSDYQFYELQHELSANTYSSIILSLVLALIVIAISTLNVLNSFYAIFTILCSIMTTMAILVLSGWKLNILESVAITSSIGLSVDFSLHYTVNYKMCPATAAESREGATRFALTSMLGPTTMAALTTAAAGAFMLPSGILAYKQIGQFLVTVMCVSWTFAIFHLGSLLAIAGPVNDFGQFHYGGNNKKEEEEIERQPGISTIADLHETETLPVPTTAEMPLHVPLRRKHASVRYTTNLVLSSDNSDSSNSAISIILGDEY